MACQVSNGQLCHILPPCMQCILQTLAVINQTQDEVININDNFWAISTLQNNKKLYITCLQYSYSISNCFPYNIIYLPDGHEANAITFVLPSNNLLNVDSIMESTESKLGFNRSYSKINNLSLMQSLDISSLLMIT